MSSLTVSQVLDAEFVEALCLSPLPLPRPARGETLAAPSPAAKEEGAPSSLVPAKGLLPRRPVIQNRIAWLDVALFFQLGVKFP
jgi:hypothetical protein